MSANFTPNQNEYKNLTPFKCWLLHQINNWGLNNFPFVESDFDELTNYGMLMKMMKALNDVISNQNEVEQDMTNLFGAFTELQDYVNSYLTDENLQPLINNKLDEMVEDGTFESILLNYTKTNRLYNTYEELIKDKNALVNDEKIKTLGYYEINDQGGCEYLVTNQEPDTFNIDLENGLYLIPIIENNSINIRQLGAKETQSTDTKALKDFASSNIKTLIVNNGTYKINDNVDFTNKEIIGVGKPKISINGITTLREHTIHIGGTCLIKNIEFNLDVGTTNILGFYNTNNGLIENCDFNVNNVPCNGYVDLYTNNQNIRFVNCNFKCSSLNNDNTNHGGGLWVREMTSTETSENIYFDNCLFYHRSSDEIIGVWKAYGTLKNVQINNCKFESDPLCTAQHFITFSAENSNINNSVIIYKPSDNNARASAIKSIDDSNNEPYDVSVNNCTIDLGCTFGNGGLFGYKLKVNGCEIKNTKDTSISSNATLRNCVLDLLGLQNRGNSYFYNCVINLAQKNNWMFGANVILENCVFNVEASTNYMLVVLFENNRTIQIENCKFNWPSNTAVNIGDGTNKTGKLYFNNNYIKSINFGNNGNITGYITNNVCENAWNEGTGIKYNNNFNINA